MSLFRNLNKPKKQNKKLTKLKIIFIIDCCDLFSPVNYFLVFKSPSEFPGDQFDSSCLVLCGQQSSNRNVQFTVNKTQQAAIYNCDSGINSLLGKKMT